MKLEFRGLIFQKNIPLSNFKKFRPVRAELFHADGRIDGQIDGHDEANCRFQQCCEKKTPKIERNSGFR